MYDLWMYNSFIRNLFLKVARNEFLSLLSMMVRGCEHESWSDLAVLLNENLEKDFFENIKHIQVRKFHADYFISLYFLVCLLLWNREALKKQQKQKTAISEGKL